jgi:hypothetical protein
MRTVEKMRYYAQESGRAGREVSEVIVMQPSVPSDRSIRVRRPCLSKLIDGKSAWRSGGQSILKQMHYATGMGMVNWFVHHYSKDTRFKIHVSALYLNSTEID